jgi:hypothetical protein
MLIGLAQLAEDGILDRPVHDRPRHPSTDLGWTTIDRQGTVSQRSLGTTPLAGLVGAKLTGGLTYHRPTNRFYALSNDPGGQVTLHQIQLAGSSSSMFPIAPGVANGLTYVPADDKFYALITRDSLSWF